MNKTTVYGLPLNPTHLLNQLKGASFCVSYGTRDKLGKQLDQAIELVGEDGILLVDNGAYSAFQAGINTMTDESYLTGFATWATDILERCDQAIAVIPDVIGGSWQENASLVERANELFWGVDETRLMPIWHLDEPIHYLLALCERFGYVGFGSCGEYLNPKTAKWRARIQEALAAIDAWLVENEGCYVRPRIHIMRCQAQAHLFAFDSSDSTNVAVNHNRQLRKRGENVAAFAARVDAKIQKSAGRPAEHQLKRGLLDHVETREHDAFWQTVWTLQAAGYDVSSAYEQGFYGFDLSNVKPRIEIDPASVRRCTTSGIVVTDRAGRDWQLALKLDADDRRIPATLSRIIEAASIDPARWVPARD